MTTWANLDNGYNIISRIVDVITIPVSEILQSNVLVNLYIDAVNNLYEIVEFVFIAFASSALIIVIFFAFWYFILAPTFKKVGIL